jgi:membrane protease YdiL (CAAX protease family)
LTDGDISYPEQIACSTCNALIPIDARFCAVCGEKQLIEGATGPVENKWSLLKQAALFYSIDLTVCCLAKFVDYFKTFDWFVIIDVIMAVNAVVFFSLNWQGNKKLLIWRNFSLQKLAAYAGIAITASILVHYSVGWLNTTIFPKEEHFYFFYRSGIYTWLLVVFVDAVTPALFEELGYRGYLMQTLLKVADREQAIYISSFLFAIIHMSFISLFWLIPFALFLGYTRIKENTIWYGIFIHFCFNFTACLFELF